MVVDEGEGGGQKEGARAASRRHWSVGRSIGGGGRDRKKRERSGESERVETRSDRIPGKVNFY